MRALVPSVAVRTSALVALAVAGWLVVAADDRPDANIGLGLLLTGSMLLAVVVWGAADGVRAAPRGRSDREGVSVWLLSGAAFGALVAAATGVSLAVGDHDPVPVGALLRSWSTYATSVAVPAAVSYGIARNVAEARINRRA